MKVANWIKNIALTALVLLSVNVGAQNPAADKASAPAPTPLAAASCPAILHHTFNRLQDDSKQDLCQYAGKVVLVVNTASFCGFTKQYEGLEALYAKYGDKGLVVLGFPSNDFLNA